MGPDEALGQEPSPALDARQREGAPSCIHSVDYETLRVIWWLLLGVLLIGFAVMDGFDLGVAALLPFVARTDGERRIVINTIGPVWEGNQVWLILGGGAIFAAWPPVYAAVVLRLLPRHVPGAGALDPAPGRLQLPQQDRGPALAHHLGLALFAAGVVPALVFGVAFGNLLQGVPFRFDSDMRILYEGSGLFELLNPFGLVCGLVSLGMLTTHGAVYLTLKADGPVKERAAAYVRIGALVTVVLFILAGLWTAFVLKGYAVTGGLSPSGPSNPLLKTVSQVRGQWFANFYVYKWMMLAPALAILGPLATIVFTAGKRAGLAFIASAAGIFGVIATAGVSMFPFLMPSDIMPQASLTVWDATSSQMTLFVMLLATLVFLPIVIAYTGFVFRVLKGPVTAKQIEGNSAHLY